jgi:signal transduction histidine kinase
MQVNTLKNLIYKNYLTSSLIPIFTIEVVLLVLYFSLSYFITTKSQEMLYKEVSESLREIAQTQSEQINNKFQEISRVMVLMQKDHELFFRSKEQCILPNGEPKFAVHENGSYFKPLDNGGASIYYASTTKLGEAELQKARCSEVIDPLMKAIVDTNPMITQAYLNTYDNFNRLYPYQNDAPMQYGPTLNIPEYNFYFLADEKHNPKKQKVWTGAYLDPAGQGWMISNIAPIYNNDLLEGVSGLDVTIDSLIKNVLELKIPWEASAFLTDSDGMILAMPQKVENLLGLKELKEHTYDENIKSTIEKPENYNLLKNSDPLIREQMQKLFNNLDTTVTLNIQGSHYILVQKVIQETNFRLMLVVDESIVFQSINQLKSQADTIGYVMIGLMILFYLLFFIYLLKKSQIVAVKISEPISTLSEKTTFLGKEPQTILDLEVGISEVDLLIKNFNTLSKELDTRTQEYIQSQIREKMKEKDIELAYRWGLFESASSYLHNIGNTLTMLDSKVRGLKNIVGALKKSGLGIDKIKSLISQSDANSQQKQDMYTFLDQFNKALSRDITNEIEQTTNRIDEIKNHAIESIRHQQDFFNVNSKNAKNYVEKFNVATLLHSLEEDFHLKCSQNGIHLSVETSEEIFLSLVKLQFRSGLSNVIKNAIESVQMVHKELDGFVKIRAYKEANKVIIEIEDNGIGIEEKNMKYMFKSGFSTKEKGHGLGLHAFNNFLNSCNGKITLQSDGLGKGALARIEVKDLHE